MNLIWEVSSHGTAWDLFVEDVKGARILMAFVNVLDDRSYHIEWWDSLTSNERNGTTFVGTEAEMQAYVVALVRMA